MVFSVFKCPVTGLLNISPMSYVVNVGKLQYFPCDHVVEFLIVGSVGLLDVRVSLAHQALVV